MHFLWQAPVIRLYISAIISISSSWIRCKFCCSACDILIDIRTAAASRVLNARRELSGAGVVSSLVWLSHALPSFHIIIALLFDPILCPVKGVEAANSTKNPEIVTKVVWGSFWRLSCRFMSLADFDRWNTHQPTPTFAALPNGILYFDHLVINWTFNNEIINHAPLNWKISCQNVECHLLNGKCWAAMSSIAYEGKRIIDNVEMCFAMQAGVRRAVESFSTSIIVKSKMWVTIWIYRIDNQYTVLTAHSFYKFWEVWHSRFSKFSRELKRRRSGCDDTATLSILEMLYKFIFSIIYYYNQYLLLEENHYAKIKILNEKLGHSHTITSLVLV